MCSRGSTPRSAPAYWASNVAVSRTRSGRTLQLRSQARHLNAPFAMQEMSNQRPERLPL
jgi:hypothetical protein